MQQIIAWVDLTDKELEAIWRETISDMACMKAVIAKFKEKNTPPSSQRADAAVEAAIADAYKRGYRDAIRSME